MTPPVSHSPGEPVGLIGTGSMGAGIGRNLLRAGHALHLFARRSDAAQPLVQTGATACASPADLGQHCRLVVLSLTDAAAVEAVLFGPQGLAGTLAPGSVVVDTSTIAATSARALADRLAAQDLWLLDAPVSGGQAGAEAGTLGCMVGGAAEVLDACRETLGAFCKTITHVGPQGAGQTVKACNQVAVAGAMLGVADAMALAKAQGVDPALMREVLLGGTARTFSLEKNGLRVIQGDYQPGFRAALMRKDLRLALDTARATGAVLPGAALAEQLLDALCTSGRADWDWSALALQVQSLQNQ